MEKYYGSDQVSPVLISSWALKYLPIGNRLNFIYKSKTILFLIRSLIEHDNSDNKFGIKIKIKICRNLGSDQVSPVTIYLLGS